MPAVDPDLRARTPTIAALLAAAITGGLAIAASSDHSRGRVFENGERDAHSCSIGLWGDLPYSAQQATVGVPSLIADMNSQRLAFTAHDGDLKAGSRMHERGVHLSAVVFQLAPGCRTQSKRLPQRTRRSPETLVEDDAQAKTDGFHDFLSALRDEVIAFRKPVAYVHDDSHYFRIDKPFENAQGQRLENFTRVETFGDHQENGNHDVNWLKVTVDPDSREVFAYQPQIVPSNRTAVPAP